MLATALVGLVGAGGVGTRSLVAQAIGPGADVAAASLSFEFYDFFKVPYGEWWDYRTAVYGDLPVNAECFSAEAIANGICSASNPAVKDFGPEANWYPLPGAIQVGNPNNNPLLYAPYRFRVAGLDVGGYSLAEPVFLPVLKPTEAAGSRLDFSWYLQYLDTATADALDAAGCPISSFDLDGFQTHSTVTLTMDLQESKRIFGVTATDAASAASWWAANTRPECYLEGPAEAAVSLWFIQMGGSSATYGKYDIANSFEWYYSPYYTQLSATVDPADGTTHVTLDHVAWGTETMLARMFYWGSAGYQANYLDSTRANGWWGMELAWFEDMTFAGSLKAAAFDFSLASAMQYHWQNLAMAEPGGALDRSGDLSYWTWGPILSDYTNDWSPKKLISELDRYPSPPYAYVHTTPGSVQYGKSLPYDYVPIKWDLALGQSWTFRFPTPTENVVLYDPNLTPLGANPVLGQFVEIRAPLVLLGTNPTPLGTFDALTNTWTVTGPTLTGGPVGSPGGDGIPGTADDQYALEPFGAILLTNGAPPPADVWMADLIGRSGWPERHHWVTSKDVDGMISLYAKVGNLGNKPVSAAVIFTVYDDAGNVLATLHSATAIVVVGTSSVISEEWTPAGPGRYRVTALVHFDKDNNGTLDTFGAKLKSFSFAVVP